MLSSSDSSGRGNGSAVRSGTLAPAAKVFLKGDSVFFWSGGWMTWWVFLSEGRGRIGWLVDGKCGVPQKLYHICHPGRSNANLLISPPGCPAGQPGGGPLRQCEVLSQNTKGVKNENRHELYFKGRFFNIGADDFATS